jgi:endonuclease YncB( thermonuclease family)
MAMHCACHPQERACSEFATPGTQDAQNQTPTPGGAEPLQGRIVGITDGDTITLLDAASRQYKIRLSGIDAPEKGQAFGKVSRQHLSELAFAKQAKADCYKIDRYKRLVCTAYVDGKDVGLAQLDAGLAWWYRKYANEQPPQERLEYEMAETKAAVNRIGLWQDKNPIPPWEWRKRTN